MGQRLHRQATSIPSSKAPPMTLAEQASGCPAGSRAAGMAERSARMATAGRRMEFAAEPEKPLRG
jgi:hypothetical protein